MNRRTLVALVAGALFSLSVPAFADDQLSGQPTAAEMPFVSAIAADLSARFPTPQSAMKAGYLRFGDEDETGAISFANRQWTSKDPQHPSQLWYDAGGRLLGADFSVPYDSAAKPNLFGVDPSRWQKFGAHAHYGLIGPDGSTVYGGVGAKKLAAAGSSVDHPTPGALVVAGIAKKTSDVRFVFAFPAIWDLSVWVLPNPAGPFAEKNPEVRPTHPKGSM